MGAHKVLLVDDEVHIVLVLAPRLEKEGFEVHTASDGLKGLEAARAVRPDVVVSDLQMPRLSGVEFAQHLAEEMPEIPVLLLTARGYVLKGFDIPPNVRDTLAKPFSTKDIATRVATLLEQSEAQAETPHRMPSEPGNDSEPNRRVA